MRKIIAALLVCIMVVFPLTGCGQQEEESFSVEAPVHHSTQKQSGSAEAEDAVHVRTLGTKTDKAYAVLLNNRTGQSITSLKVGTDETIGTAADLLNNSETVVNEEQIKLYYTPESSSDTGSGDKELPPQYLLSFSLADGTGHTLHAFPFGDIDEGTIKIQDDGIAFLSYMSKSTRDSIDTYESEKAVKEQAKEAAEKAAAAEAEKVAAEEARKKEAAEAEKKAAEEAEKKAVEEAAKASENASNASAQAAGASGNTGNSSSSNTGNSQGSNSGNSSGNGSSTTTSTTESHSQSSSGNSSGGTSSSNTGSESSSSSSSDSGSGGGSSADSSSSSDTGSGGSSASADSNSSGDSEEDGCVGDGLTY